MEKLVSRDMLYCFPLADVLLCKDPEQDGCVCVCLCVCVCSGSGWGKLYGSKSVSYHQKGFHATFQEI